MKYFILVTVVSLSLMASFQASAQRRGFDRPIPGGHVYPGYHGGYGYGYAPYRGYWGYPYGAGFPAWAWAPGIVGGVWQCTAFNSAMQPFSQFGVTLELAEASAFYACGGQMAGCFIPYNYCQLR